MKRSIILILVLTMAISLFSGCSGSNKSKDESTNASEQSTSDVVEEAGNDGPSNPMPIVTGGNVTLSVLTVENPYSGTSLTENLPAWQEMEKITGVKIEWQVVNQDQYEITAQTRLAAGINLPDIIDMPGEAYKYGVGGIVIPLDEYIEKYGEYAAKCFEEKPKLLSLMKSPEGITYNLSSVRDEEMQAGPTGWLVRKDWLDALGLEEPKTTDDWLKVFRAFKANDVNGNGNPSDEIPFSNRNGLRQLLNWGGCWDLHLKASEGFYPNSEGKIEYEWFKPEAKEMVLFLRKLYEEQLIDPEALTNTKEQYTSRITSNLVGSTIQWQEYTTNWNSVLREGGDTDAHWVMVDVPHADGYKGFLETEGYANGIICISKDCKNPDIAFRWLDYLLYSEDAAKLMTVGIEGMTYHMENNEIVMNDIVTKNPDGLGPVEVIRSIGAWQYMPFRLYSKYVSKLKLSDPEHIERTAMVADKFVDKMEFGIATDEENNAIMLPLTDITTYLQESVTGFITGTKPMEEWDSFIQTIKDTGIDKILEVRQAQYDRLQKNSK